MLTNTERQQIVEEVNAGTYGIDEALDDIAAAQKGEEVRKALYAEALVLNREGHAGSTDMIARQQVANLQTSVNGQISTLRTEVGDDIDDLEAALNSGLAAQNGKIAAQNASIANVVKNYNLEYGSETLWEATGETGLLASGTTATLSKDVSNFDYVDIYSFCGNINVLDTVPVDAKLQSTQGYATRWVNLSDPDSGSYKAYVRIVETRFHIIGTTLTIDHQVTYRNGEEVNISGAEITQSNRSTYMGEFGIMKVVGRKITANTEIEDVRIGADGTEYVSAGQAVRAQVTALESAIPAVDSTLSTQGAAADAKVAGDEFASLKSAIDNVVFPLELVTTYEKKVLRKTGLADNNDFNTYLFKIPTNCYNVNIKTNFYGNVFIAFTDMNEDGNFSANPVQFYPTSGYPTPTTVDDDYDTNGFSYVWVPLYINSGVTPEVTTSLLNIVYFVGNKSIIAQNTTGGITDFNNAERNRIYVITSKISGIANYPPISNGGTLLCFAAYDIDNVQVFVSTQNAVFIRRMWGTTWGAWKQIATADTVQDTVDTAVSAAFAGYYPYNILSAFKNITCIGDSLTYSQVYTGASSSRQAYKPYPQILAEKSGATPTILATPGDTSMQAWNRNGDNITSKDAQLTIIYLGTNGGLTDTISTDLTGDDYTAWAETNTGCYGKIIAKSLAVGSKVVLVKVHSSSGGVATTNSVIEQMASKFNVPFIDNTYLSGRKYHSYPDGTGTNGTHYNDLGYSVFVDQVINSISHLSADDLVKIIPV